VILNATNYQKDHMASIIY